MHRKLIEWEWYKDINVKTLFLHLLLTANHSEQKWQGTIIQRGQTITSREHLANETGLTIQQVRTALNKLKSTQEITIKTTKKYTVITVEKYIDYQVQESKSNQVNNQEDNQQITNKQPTDNQQITINKNEKNDNNNYFILFNKYSEKLKNVTFGEKIRIIGQCKNTAEYGSMSFEDQEKLFSELMHIK